MNDKINDTPGLTVRQFYESLTDYQVRQLFDKEILSLLDTVFGGKIVGEELRRVAQYLVDFFVLLGESDGRKFVLNLLSERKRSELEVRAEIDANPSNSDSWTNTNLKILREFFGFSDDRIISHPIPTTEDVVPAYGLFNHQRNVVTRLMPLLTEDDRRAIMHLPTGVGKTRTAMHIVAKFLRKHEPSVVVWLASSKELIEQAVEEFRVAWSHLGTRHVQLGTLYGTRTLELDKFSDGFLAIGLAKSWAMVSRSDPDWATRMSQKVSLVVFDEAHQSIAKTYKQVTEELTLNFRCALLGLTATPGRTWNDIDEDGRLANFYSGNKITLETPCDNPIRFLIKNGFLAHTTFKTLLSTPGLVISDRELHRIANSLEIPQEIVASLSISSQYVMAVLSAIEELLDGGHRRIIVFAASVRQANVLSSILIARGTRSHVVLSTTSSRARAKAINSFKSNDVDPIVIVNFGVLTTGFDVPKISAAVIARPTKSLVLYSQMVGRAIRGREARGTDDCTIVTVVDKQLPGFGDLAELFLNWEDAW